MWCTSWWMANVCCCIERMLPSTVAIPSGSRFICRYCCSTRSAVRRMHPFFVGCVHEVVIGLRYVMKLSGKGLSYQMSLIEFPDADCWHYFICRPITIECWECNRSGRYRILSYAPYIYVSSDRLIGECSTTVDHLKQGVGAINLYKVVSNLRFACNTYFCRLAKKSDQTR